MSADDLKELLPLAARAMGALYVDQWEDGRLLVQFQGEKLRLWNPLTDDGDALRLAVKLNIQIELNFDESGCVYANHFGESLTPDPCAATRRAIVRAAAEIGRAMK